MNLASDVGNTSPTESRLIIRKSRELSTFVMFQRGCARVENAIDGYMNTQQNREEESG